MTVAIAGAGAFGTALAIALAARGPVTLLARDATAAGTIARTRENPRLPGAGLPGTVRVTADPAIGFSPEIILLAIPAQALRPFLSSHATALAGKALVACGKGIDLATLKGPTASIAELVPTAIPAVLTGPSFAADIARGLPTALTLASRDGAACLALQAALSTPQLRLYRSGDTVGAELGGALKNVIAIACGACIGAGLGDSARAALMTRGFAEMRRLAAHLGADPETLTGLSGLGDLALTCGSDLSRNFAFGLAIGRGAPFDAAVTVEGAATARAACALAEKLDLDLPVCQVTAGLVTSDLTVADAMARLLDRPLKEE